MPEGGFRATNLARIEARLVAHDWPWARENAAGIAANWRARRARAPALFDGPVLLSCACAVDGEVCRVDLFEARYAAFIAYRDGGAADGRVANAFAAIVPWSSDGAVLVGEMGASTANAGQLYFPCGTPDRDDVRGDHVDLAGSAARELFEETGLAVPQDALDDAPEAWTLFDGQGQLAFLRPVRFPEPAEVLVDRIAKRLRGEAAPELAGIRALRGPADLDAGPMAGFARAYLAGAFA